MGGDKVTLLLSKIEKDLKELRTLLNHKPDDLRRLKKQKIYHSSYYLMNRDRLLVQSR